MLTHGSGESNSYPPIAPMAAGRHKYPSHPTVISEAGHQSLLGREFLVDSIGIVGPGRLRSFSPPPTELEIAMAMDWLTSRAEPSRSPKVDSYLLKHLAENWAGFYISDGAMIAAASRLQIPQEVDGTLSTLVSVANSCRKLPEADWMHRTDTPWPACCASHGTDMLAPSPTGSFHHGE
ncbi:hypothetical protein K227x_05900 [Rubripirellula lacrimiformis]|uniref:Uncharacterized protein n=1 Tax=Rubripirellula lacrimiformis TaxID=1930273 RepID=A0A517N5B4_9BACT|nr:hypothetical protein K227x_05900 [Rubripirellula lacrimiformis]